MKSQRDTGNRPKPTQAGVWIDHRKAVIVTISGEGEKRAQVESHVEKHVRYSGGAPGGSHGSREGAGEDTRERHFAGQLSKYYDDVIVCLQEADAILVFGPGEAKDELRTHLQRAGLGARIVDVETVDKMTDGQIAAKARERFGR